jgi:hypothetical protein
MRCYRHEKPAKRPRASSPVLTGCHPTHARGQCPIELLVLFVLKDLAVLSCGPGAAMFRLGTLPYDARREPLVLSVPNALDVPLNAPFEDVGEAAKARGVILWRAVSRKSLRRAAPVI